MRIDLKEIRHTPMPARSPRGRRSVTDVVVTLKARVAQLETELAQAEERSTGHRLDFEHERARADQLVTTQDRMVAELESPPPTPTLTPRSRTAGCPAGHLPNMARDNMVRAVALAAQ